MKNNFFLYGSILILSFSLLPLPEPQIHHLKCIGGTGKDDILYVIKLSDGNYLSCGFTDSHDGDFDAKNGGSDAFLLKTDNKGNIIWKNTYGGSRDEVFYNIIETATGDILAIGTAGSNDKQVTNHHGTPGTDDVWLVKTNSSGQLIKERCYGGSKSESTWDLGMSEGIMIDKNGNILLVAETNSNDGDVSGNHGDYDGWLVKVNPSTFDIIKSKTIGTANYEAAYNIYEINGDLFVTGSNSAVAYSTTNVKTVEDNGGGFAAKINASTFDAIWYKTYGGSGSEYLNASVISQDGNLVLTGHAASTDGDCVGNNGDFNTWTWKVNVSDGSIIWKNFTGVAGDTSSAFNLIATHDGGFAAVGVVVERSSPDAFVVRIDANGKTQWTKRFGGSAKDEIMGGIEINAGKFLLGGLTSSDDGVVSGFHQGSVSNQESSQFPGGKRPRPNSDAWLVELNEN
ncbi:MAG TPA: hypothetical protein VFU29_23520 [Chitinophagaceae bacterium]|nr:hypothetical protein [Chitinophagaceae bacterium]